MSFYYIETSALLKKYGTEKGSEVVVELFNGKLESEVFATSYLTVLEVASVVTRMSRARTLPTRAYRAILANLAKDMDDVIEVRSVADSVM